MTMLTTTGKPARPLPSTKPLATRLRIEQGAKVAVLASPEGFDLGVSTSSTPKGADVVLLFAETRAVLGKWGPKLKTLPASTVLWIAYPKTTSGRKTDLTRDVGWEAMERAGLRAVTQVAVDETWSALRFRRSPSAAS
ncbi:MAG TPA: hypothetical protein VM925_34675 [Labilithrix sp.]|nr:hypothetical protein [Labilithrix sp.]